jgi:hypothetical protein
MASRLGGLGARAYERAEWRFAPAPTGIFSRRPAEPSPADLARAEPVGV